MANPNIVNVTSIYGQSMGEALTTTLTTDIMTAQSNKLLKINFIQVTNTHATASTDVTVAVTKVAYTSGGIADAEDNIITEFAGATINLAFSTSADISNTVTINYSTRELESIAAVNSSASYAVANTVRMDIDDSG